MVPWPSAASNFELLWLECEECLTVAYCLPTVCLLFAYFDFWLEAVEV